jgi:hypothetical protein
MYKTINLPSVLYGCETWSLIPREEQRKCSKREVLRIIFAPKRNSVTGSWGKLLNEEL